MNRMLSVILVKEGFDRRGLINNSGRQTVGRSALFTGPRGMYGLQSCAGCVGEAYATVTTIEH